MMKTRAAKITRKILNRIADNEFEDDTKKVNANKNYYESSTQEYLPIKAIRDGFVITPDNRYVGIIEIMPSNFFQKSKEKQKQMSKAFETIFRSNIAILHFKIISDTSNPTELIRSMQKNCLKKDNPKALETLQDNINTALRLGNQGAVSIRYLLSFEYNGNLNTSKERNEAEILQAMKEERANIVNILNNALTDPILDTNPTNATAERLYYYFNRNTVRNESLQSRHIRIAKDIGIYNKLTGENKTVTFKDLIAPKGIDFRSRKFIYSDGSYYTYLALDPNTYPGLVETGWLNCLLSGSFVDLDIICKKLPKKTVQILLSQYNKMSGGVLTSISQARREARARSKANIDYIIKHLKAGDELYDTAIIITLKADTKRELNSLRRLYRRALKNNGLNTKSCFLDVEDYYKMTMPFTYITKPFYQKKHPLTSTALGSLYMFTAYQLYDPSGFLLGTNKENSTLVAPNNYDTQMYNNGNILILGTSGAGKTFTQETIGTRMHSNGIRSSFIIPKKGYEYKPGCDMVDGTYVKLGPGFNDCVNILAIYPEGTINKSAVSEDVQLESGSLLMKKVNNIKTWLELLSDKPFTSTLSAKLDKKIIETYNEKGITDDNRTIFYEDGVLKEMPIISELQAKFLSDKNDFELIEVANLLNPFTEGSFKNLNGQTNINLDNSYIVFDCDEDDIGSKLLPAILYIPYEYVYNITKSNPLIKNAIFLDEVWKMMKHASCAEQVQNMVKLVRGYGGCTIIATQELRDFLGASGNFGYSVINLSELLILLNMKPEELELVKTTLKLSDEDCSKIATYKKGDGMIVSNGNKTEVKIIPSERELYTLTTDINLKQQLAAQRVRNAG